MLVAVAALAYTIPLISTAAGSKPSFMCGTGNDAVELAVCANDELSRLDVVLANVYARIREAANPDDKQALLEQQLTWNTQLRADACTSVECLRKSYRDRVWFLVDQAKELGIADPRGVLHPGEAVILGGLKAQCMAVGVKLEPNGLSYDEQDDLDKDGTPILRPGPGDFSPTRLDCHLTDGTTIRVKTGFVTAPSEQGLCGSTPPLRISVWINGRRVMSSLQFTDSCEVSLVSSLSVTRNRLDYCIAQDAPVSALEGTRFKAPAGACSGLRYVVSAQKDSVEFPPHGRLTLAPHRFALTAVESMKKTCGDMLAGQSDSEFRLSPPLGATFPDRVKRSGNAVAQAFPEASVEPFVFEAKTYIFVSPHDIYEPYTLALLTAGKIQPLCAFQQGRDTF